MRQARLRRLGFFSLSLVVAAGALGSACNCDGGGPGPDAGPPTVVELDPPLEEDVAAAFSVAPFHVLRARLDANGDGQLDSDDTAALESCLSASDAAARPECDLVPDGVLDEQDLRLFRVLVGEHHPLSTSLRQLVADNMLSLAEDPNNDPGIVALVPDYNVDGTRDVEDVRLFTALLRNDPLSRLDLDDNGRLDFADMRVMSLALHTGETLPAAWDLNEDGVVDDFDLLLTGTLASTAADTTPGVLDYDLDGRVSRADFCVVATARDASLLELFFTPDDAAALFASEAPEVSVCRKDGHSVIRYPSRIGAELELVLSASSLYLAPVSEVPEGWSPQGGVPEGAPLYVFTTTPSDVRVRSVALPLTDLPDEGDSRLELTGGPLPTGAVIVTPNGAIPTGAVGTMSALNAPPDTSTASFQEESVTQTITVVGTVLEKGDSGEAGAFQAALDGALATYDGYIAGCPCELEGDARAEMVRGLIRMKNCLAAVQAAAMSALEDAQRNHQVIANDHVLQSRLSALSWQHLSATVEDVAWANVVLLVLETLCDGAAEGGLVGSLKSALGSLTAELIKDNALPEKDFFSGGDPGGQISQTLDDMELGAVSNAVSGAVVDSIQELVKQGGKASAEAFTKTVLTGVESALKSMSKAANLKPVLKAVIKMLPNLYLEYIKRHTFHQHQISVDAGERYLESQYTIANWRGVITAMSIASDRVDDTLTRLLDKMSADGCPVTITNADPCQPALQIALDEAGAQLTSDLAAADQAIADALAGLAGASGEQEACFGGSQRQELDEAQIAYSDAAARVAALVGKVDIEAVQEQLDIELEHAAETLAEKKATWFLNCVTSLGDGRDSSATWQALVDAQRAKQDALDAHEDAVRAALADYADCSGAGGGCGGTTTGESSAWTQALACLECMPAIEMDCEEPELPDDIIALGNVFGLDLLGIFIPVVISTLANSAPARGEKPVANDHTTFTGVGYARATLDQTTVDQLDETHPCDDTDSIVVCASDAPPPPGDYHLLFFQTASAMPATSSYSRQLATVFDADGDTTNNYTPPAQYANDFWQDADLAYGVTYTPGDGWGMLPQDMTNGVFSSVQSDARLIIDGTAGVFMIPSSDFGVLAPGVRFTNYEHDGNWGQTPGSHWEGSVYPSVSEGLYLPPP